MQGASPTHRRRLRILPEALLREASHAGITQLRGTCGRQEGRQGQKYRQTGGRENRHAPRAIGGDPEVEHTMITYLVRQRDMRAQNLCLLLFLNQRSDVPARRFTACHWAVHWASTGGISVCKTAVKARLLESGSCVGVHIWEVYYAGRSGSDNGRLDG